MGCVRLRAKCTLSDGQVACHAGFAVDAKPLMSSSELPTLQVIPIPLTARHQPNIHNFSAHKAMVRAA